MDYRPPSAPVKDGVRPAHAIVLWGFVRGYSDRTYHGEVNYMDACENLVALLLQREGYWTRISLKVCLTKAEKRRIGRPSSPRWELDVVAYKGSTNEILVVECKSFLDSRGVAYADVTGRSNFKRYKLFNEKVLRDTVLNRLKRQLVEEGACAKNPHVRLCLAAGKVVSPRDEEQIERLFKQHGWRFFRRERMAECIKSLADCAYENDIAVVVAKLLTG